MSFTRTPALAATAALTLLPSVAQAALLLTGTVLPLGGSFRYEFSVENTDPTDYVLVSFTDAPLGDPLIDPTLTSPAGFSTSYDAGLGFLDLVGDVDLFAAGTTQGTFSFESLTPPDRGFANVTAYDLFLDQVAGTVRWQVIPEPAAGTALALGLLAAAFGFRRKFR